MSTENPPLITPSLRLSPTYGPRPIVGLAWRQLDAWHLKRYAITSDDQVPSTALMETAMQVAAGALPRAQEATHTHGVGFVITHQGRDGNYVLVHWWTHENMLAQKIYIAPQACVQGPENFERFDSHHIVSCVWEVQVLAFEARAWIAHVLKQPEQPDIASYLNDHLEGSF